MRVQKEELVVVAVVLVVVVVVGGTVGGVDVEGRLRPQGEGGGGVGAVHAEECGIRGGH